MNIPEKSVSSQKPKNTLVIGRFPSPIGDIFVASGNKGLKELCIGKDKAGFVARLERKYRARIVEREAGFARLFKLLDSYFKGKRVSFGLGLDIEGAEFELKVWAALSRIPYGKTKTYGEVASEIGRYKWARAVGGACAKNPLPIIVPCHRVMGSGGIGGYSAGGAETKKFLLRLEGLPSTTFRY